MTTTEIKPTQAPWGALAAEDFAPKDQAAFRRAARRIKGPRQVGGDDGYQYALWCDGRQIANGMTRIEATHRKNRAILNLMNGRPA